MKNLSLDYVKQVFPKKFRSYVTQECVDGLNDMMNKSETGAVCVENFLSYSNIVKEFKCDIKEYSNAIKFITLKFLGYSNPDAYKRIFPERWERIKDKPQNIRDNFANRFSQTKLVTRILQEALVPTWIVNAPLHQKALNELAKMIDDPSVRGMAKVKACEAVLNYTKPPEPVTNTFNVNLNQDDDVINELRNVTKKLASTLRTSLENGGRTLQDVAEEQIVDVEYEEQEEPEALKKIQEELKALTA